MSNVTDPLAQFAAQYFGFSFDEVDMLDDFKWFDWQAIQSDANSFIESLSIPSFEPLPFLIGRIVETLGRRTEYRSGQTPSFTSHKKPPIYSALACPAEELCTLRNLFIFSFSRLISIDKNVGKEVFSFPEKDAILKKIKRNNSKTLEPQDLQLSVFEHFPFNVDHLDCLAFLSLLNLGQALHFLKMKMIDKAMTFYSHALICSTPLVQAEFEEISAVSFLDAMRQTRAFIGSQKTKEIWANKDESIKNALQDFIEKLPHEERKSIASTVGSYLDDAREYLSEKGFDVNEENFGAERFRKILKMMNIRLFPKSASILQKKKNK